MKLQIIWDFSIERFTIGGAIVLRQEAEYLAEINKINRIYVFIKNYSNDISNFDRVYNNVFNSSVYKFELIKELDENEFIWPTPNMLNNENFSYFSFDRLKNLFETYKLPFLLKWDLNTITNSKNFSKSFTKPVLSVHLKHVFPYDITESNAQIDEWLNFFNNNQSFDFILIGDDNVYDLLSKCENVYTTSHLTLSEQLCLVTQTNGFIGTASGICNAAFFSNIPFIVFKHPKHHVKEMEYELGSSNKFPFSTNKQLLLREIADTKSLNKALNFILK